MHTGVAQYAEHEYDKHFGQRHRFIDFIKFSNFQSGAGTDMSTGILRCGEREYGNCFARVYRFIDFIDFFFIFAQGRVRTCQVGFSNMPDTNMTNILHEIID
ncbi:hypothetical protein Y032_0491g2393 [Ancylostoma ceylanicum]|uniref:Uncharacterized protein n=1 Tax=Ancylostoma ceylanicum TaxID=53326 RepID=A0A016WV00_9BILA|nr:hypothetical protein Y032_0491g2393 [Ancylostoma ceylanicum]